MSGDVVPVDGSPCVSCDGELPPAARFCPACGTATTAPLAPAAPQAERRMVTVVFADLAGFTTMAEGRDPEAVKELLDACFGTLVPVIEEHGGVVDKIIGDELMAVFGAPRAHEDDPERAVRAGLALLDALGRLDPALEMRVGINTGEVLAGAVGPSGAYTVTGDTVNTAHRLVGVARRGTVLVGGRTFAATRDAILYGSPASVRLRGRTEPVTAHRALRARPRRSARPPVAASTAMVGRDAPLRRLVDVVRTSADRLEPQLAVVVGEPGVGKSRLVDELSAAVEREALGARVLVVSSTPFGPEGPLAPVAAFVRAALDIDERLHPAVQRSEVALRLAELPLEPGMAERLLPPMVALLGLAEPEPSDAGGTGAPRSGPAVPSRIDQLALAARAVLDSAAAEGPLVLVLDDAHAADPLVLSQLERLPTWHARRAVTVVVVGRDDLRADRPRLTTSRSPRHHVIDLEPLDEAAASRMLQLTLGAIDGSEGTVTPEVERTILRAAGGNPLLLDQMARYLRETGALVEVEGGWRAVADLTDVGLPDGTRTLLGARLDGLPAVERELLQSASVVGRTFTLDALAALECTPDDQDVQGLIARGLLQPGRHGDELQFRHAMVRDAAYASVPLGDRRARHAALATWLAGRGDQSEAQVAHHLERAVSLGRELGRAGGDEDDHRAAAHLLTAARGARQRDELRDADHWYQRLRDLELLSGTEALVAGLEHASVLMSLRRLAEAEAAYRHVADHAPALTSLAAEACTGLGMVTRLQGDVQGATEWFDAGRTAWREAGDVAGEASSVRLSGWAELMAGRPRAALAKLLRARELEEQSGTASGYTLQSLAWCEYLIGDHAQARAHLWEAAQALHGTTDRGALAWCFGILGHSFWQEGRVEQARTIAEALLSMAGGQAEPWGEGMCLVLLAACQLEGGDVEAARDAALRAVRAFAELDDPWGDANARLVQAMVERVDGDLPAAIATLERGLRTAHRVGAVGSEARLRAELAASLLDAGDEAGAEREARATLTLVRSGGGDQDSEIRSLVVLAKRAHQLGEHAEAVSLLDEATASATGEVRTSIWRRAAALAAIAAAESGEVARAQSLAASAAEGSWESARTWVLAERAAAAVQLASGDRAGARVTLAAIVHRFRDRPLAFVDIVRDELAELTA